MSIETSIYWVVAALGFFFALSDAKDRDWIGCFLASGLMISSAACALTS